MSIISKVAAIELIIKRVRKEYNYEETRKKWRKRNLHNYTEAYVNDECPSFPMEQVKVGKYSYGKLHVKSYTGEEPGLEIGSFCSIADGCKFLLGGGHDYKRITTYPISYWFYGEKESETKGRIVVEDDVWIGENSIILSGVRLGRGTVVAAGSVVTHSTRPYSIVGGNPAHLIKERFSSTVVDRLMRMDFDHLTPETIRGQYQILCKELDEENIKEILDIITKSDETEHNNNKL